jgi:O-antigen/teichoic acid export membrane protein
MTIERTAAATAPTMDAPPSHRMGRVLAIALSRPDVLWSVADQFMVSAANFAIGILAARALGVAEFGRFAVILIIATMLQAASNVILSMPMMTLAGRRPNRSQGYYWAIMAWNGILSAGASVVAGLFVVAMFAFRDGAVPWALVGAAALYAAGNSLHFMLRRVLFAQGLGARAFALDAVRYVGTGAGLLLITQLGTPTAESVLFALGVPAFVAFLTFLPGLARGRVTRRLMLRVLTRHWPFAKWLLPMTALTILHEQAIFVGVGMMLGDSATGALRSGQYLLGITHFLTMAMENFVPTGAARAYNNGGAASLRTYLTRQMILFGALIGSLILVMAVYAKWWLVIAFGPGYAEFEPLLRIYAASYCCIFIRDVWTHYFRAIERTDIILKAFGWSFVAALVLFYPALRYFGVTGAALVVLAAHAVSMVIMLASVADAPAERERTR